MNKEAASSSKPTLTDLGGSGAKLNQYSEHEVKLAPITVQVWEGDLEKHASLEIPEAGKVYVRYLVNARNKLYSYLHMNDTETDEFLELLEQQMLQVIQQLVGVQATQTHRCKSFTFEPVYQRKIKSRQQVTLHELKNFRLYMLTVEMYLPPTFAAAAAKK